MRNRRIILLMALGWLGILAAQSPVAMMQYYWNAGDWDGAAEVPFTPGEDVIANILLDVSGLEEGLNHLHFRARNQAGNWSLPIHKLVFATGNAPIADVVSAEWWLDEDPGEGEGQFIELADGADVQQAIVLALGDSPLGFHHLGIRVKNSVGNWSQPFWHTVFKPGYPDIADIQSITWYFTGPGVDESSSYQMAGVTPGQDVQTSEAIPITHLEEGQTYFLHVYASSTRGQRSHEEVVKFTVGWIPDPHLTILGSTCLISWAAISGTTYYRILVSNDPSGEFVQLGTTTGTLWMDAVQHHRFFRVVAVRD